VTRYEIRDAEGTLQAIHKRTDTTVTNADGTVERKKAFTWIMHDGTIGLNGRPVNTLPLYGTELLRQHPGEAFILGEGEKVKDALQRAGYLALGTVTGAGAKMPYSEAILTPLQGHPILTTHDHDPPGHLHMQIYEAAMMRLGIAVKRIVWNEAPPGGDLADFIEQHGAGEALIALIAAAVPITMEDLAVAQDAPVYRMTPKGIMWMKPTPFGPMETPLTNFTARILADITEDDGVEPRAAVELEARVGARTARITVPIERFAGLGWAAEALGTDAAISPGMTVRDHARYAIQVLSTEKARFVVFTHIGWREINGVPCYLHAGGAIGASGIVPHVHVRLDKALEGFVVPEPRSGDTLRAAVQASLRILNIAPDMTTVPLAGATYRAPLGNANMSIWFIGPTGAFKTAIATLGQQHYGAGMHAKALPADFQSTANSNADLQFLVKDALLVIDDFAPRGGRQDMARLQRDADRLVRGQANRQGRRRMRADGTLRPDRPPRGLTVFTGEDLIQGQSGVFRAFVVRCVKEDVNLERLTACQRDAAAGLYAQAMAGYVRWLASRYGTLASEITWKRDALRAEIQAAHPRTPEIVAELLIGIEYMLAYAVDIGAIDQVAALAIEQRARAALTQGAQVQNEYQRIAEPTSQFLILLHAVIVSGRVHVATMTGSPPANPLAYGWQSLGEDKNGNPIYRPQGDWVGCTDNLGNLYLFSEVAFAAVQRLGEAGGEVLNVTMHTLKRRLYERGLLASISKRGNWVNLEVQKTILGVRRPVLHLREKVLASYGSPTRPSRPRPGKSRETGGRDVQGAGEKPSCGSRPPQDGFSPASGGDVVDENPAGGRESGRDQNERQAKGDNASSDFGRDGREYDPIDDKPFGDDASSVPSDHSGEKKNPHGLEVVVQAYRDILPEGEAAVSHRSLYTRLCELTGLANQAVGALIASALAARVLLRVSPLVYRLAGLP
jgi:hypothetical protein